MRGPGLWKVNNSYLNESDFAQHVYEIIKTQTRIHTDVSKLDSEWDALLIEANQYISLSNRLDARLFLDSLLPSVRGFFYEIRGSKETCTES